MMCDAVLYDVSGPGLITASSLHQMDYDFDWFMIMCMIITMRFLNHKNIESQ